MYVTEYLALKIWVSGECSTTRQSGTLTGSDISCTRKKARRDVGINKGRVMVGVGEDGGGGDGGGRDAEESRASVYKNDR